MTHPESARGEGATVVTAYDEPPELPPRFRSGLSGRGIDLSDEIGRGAMSLVYRATDRDHARTVAVKILRPSPGAEYDPGRFLREIQLAAGLQHPHILPVYGSGTVDGTLYYVMPYVEGESLRARLNRIGPLPVHEAIQIAREVADALDYAHDRGVVHRDIKPENILLEAGHAVVADFGVALVLMRPAETSPGSSGDRLTSIGMVVGTPAYMSPEQASGDRALDGRSDLYALGCVLYEMLAGEPPFSGPTPQATIARRFQGPPVPLRQRRPEIPPAVAAVIDKALAIEPSERFATGAEFAAALAAAERRRGLGRASIAVLVGSLALTVASLVAARIPHRRLLGFNPRRVAVAALSNETGDTTLAPLGRMVASWITDRLSAEPGVAVVTSATVLPAQHDQHFTEGDADDPKRLHGLAVETRAGTLVSGSYYRGAGGMIEFHVEITDANTGRLVRAIGPVRADGDPERTADQLSTAVAAAVDTLAITRGFPIRDAEWPWAAKPENPTR
jgi:hypothetical protein